MRKADSSVTIRGLAPRVADTRIDGGAIHFMVDPDSPLRKLAGPPDSDVAVTRYPELDTEHRRVLQVHQGQPTQSDGELWVTERPPGDLQFPGMGIAPEAIQLTSDEFQVKTRLGPLFVVSFDLLQFGTTDYHFAYVAPISESTIVSGFGHGATAQERDDRIAVLSLLKEEWIQDCI